MASQQSPPAASNVRVAFLVNAALICLVFLAFSIGAIAYFLDAARDEQNTAAHGSSVHLVETALDDVRRSTANWAKDYAWWDTTLEQATGRLDLEWAEANIGQYLQDTFGISGSFVVSPDNVTTFHSPRAGDVIDDAFEFLGKDAKVFLSAVQATSMAESVVLTHYVRHGERTYLVAAAPITAEDPSAQDLTRKPRFVLVLYKELNEALLNELEARYLLDGVRVTAKPASGELGEIALNGVNGQPSAYVTWMPPRPGDGLFRDLLPRFGLVSLTLIVVGSLIFFSWWRSVSQASEAKSKFLAHVSHELRTPLNPIIGFSDVISSETFGPLPERYRSYASDIHRSGVHLSSIVDNLLDFTKVEAGEMELHESEFHIAELVDELPPLNSLLWSRDADNDEVAPLRIDKQVPPDLPKLRADPLRVRQVLLNLLSNAAKFSGGDSVLFRATSDNGEIRIVVEDHGVGIAPDDLERIFTPFTQVGSVPSNLRSRGSGLGLALSRDLMDFHGGTLVLESDVGIGTRAIMTFPRERTVPAG